MNRELQKTYDRIAEEWHRDHQADDWWVEGTNTFLELLPRGATVLDVGCGSGVKAKYLAERGCAVTGVDISQGLLDIAKREVPQAAFKLVPMEELDSLEKIYDGVFAQASLLHIPKAEAGEVVRKMAGRVKDGGCVYLAVKERRPDQPDEAIVRENDYGFAYERFFSYYSMKELERYLSDAGLKVVKKVPNPNPTSKTVWLQIIGQKC